MRGVGEIDITRPRWSERPTTLVPAILGNITLANSIAVLNADPGGDIAIVGNGHTIDGAGSYQGFFVTAGSVTLSGLTPGNYHVYTFAGAVELAYRNRDALAAQFPQGDGRIPYYVEGLPWEGRAPASRRAPKGRA